MQLLQKENEEAYPRNSRGNKYLPVQKLHGGFRTHEEKAE